MNILKIFTLKTWHQYILRIKVQSQGTKGVNKGSQGFGTIKCSKTDATVSNSNVFLSGLDKIQQIKAFGLFMLVWKELIRFVKSTYVDHKHFINCLYVLISVYSIGEDFFNSILLIDILNKIPALSHIYSIFTEQAFSLVSTLALFLVVLYISSFYAFREFPGDFETIVDPDSWFYDKHAPDFFMYCGDLT